MLKLELISSDKLRILFDNNDMTRLDINFTNLDYKNKKTRKIFWDAIGAAKKETGFDPTGSKLLIEAFPEKDGGLSLYVTKLINNKITTSDLSCCEAPGNTYILSFACSNDLLDAVHLFCDNELKIIESSLYEYDNALYLIFSVRDTDDDKLLDNLFLALSEYSVKEDNYYLEAFLKEHGAVISEEYAIQKMLSGIKK